MEETFFSWIVSVCYKIYVLITKKEASKNKVDLHQKICTIDDSIVV